MAYIFLDESGQFTKHNHENYFIVGSFTVGNPQRTEKRFRSWHRSRFPKKLRYLPEIKFSDVNITDSLRISTLQYISNLDIRICYLYFKRRNIPIDYRHKNSIKSGHLYTHIIGEVAEMYLPITDRELRIFCDQRHLKGIKRSQFKQILKSHLVTKLAKNSIIQIEMIDSQKNSNIQIADWNTGALAHYLEKKKLGKDFYQILKNNIIGKPKELFKDYWQNKFAKQKTQS